jgi:serine-type D-Ala-D-Ala carboxypeptidase (penicillin-binding protein 5/6)
MKRIIFVLTVLLIVGISELGAQNPNVPSPQAVPTPQAVPKPNATGSTGPAPIPAAPQLPLKSYVLTEFESGQILAQQNADVRVEPASITKIMAAYVAFIELRAGRLKLTDEVTISEKAWRMEGSRMFAEVGDKIPAEQLILGMIVQSGNDSTVALAEHIAGSEDAFVVMMNDYAKKIGLTGTHFTNAPGLSDPEHYSTAADIAKLARTIISEFPDYYKWYSVREYTWNDVKQYNRNQLLARDHSVDGMKTGHTENAGYCLVSSAKRDGFRLIAVVMGSDSEVARTAQSQTVLNYGFRFFEAHQLYAAAQVLASPMVYKGASDAVKVGIVDTLRVVIPRGHYGKLSASMEMPTSLIAPFAKHQSIGKLSIKLDGKLITERSIVAIEAVPEGGFFTRMADGIALWWKSD